MSEKLDMRKILMLAAFLSSYVTPTISMESATSNASIENSTLFSPKTLTDQLMYSTVRIEMNDGEISTSFLFNFNLGDQKEDKRAPCIVTNKHVFKNTTLGSLVFHEADDSGKIPLKQVIRENMDFKDLIISHPDERIDLCAIPLIPILNKINPKKAYLIFLDHSIIPSDEVIKSLSAVEDILMVGYPANLCDEVNNLPIFRKGITSSHPAININGNPEFMVDASCFPGSSGSPVFLYNNGFYTSGNTTFAGSSRLLLLGVLHSGAAMESKGKIFSKDIPTLPTLVSESSIMLNLGYVIKSNQLDIIKSELIKRIEEK